MKKLISMIACVLAIVLCLTACGQAAANPTEGLSLVNGGTLVLGVNPEIAVEYDENGTVTARNDDALAIINSCTGLILLVFSNHKCFDCPCILVVRCTDAAAENASRELVAQHVKKLSLKSKSVSPGCIELNYEVRLTDADTALSMTWLKIPVSAIR